MLQDGRPDLVPGRRPGGDALFRAEPRCQRDRPVQRHPAHQLGVEEIARLAAERKESEEALFAEITDDDIDSLFN